MDKQKYMIFVDGTNFLLRIAETLDVKFKAEIISDNIIEPIVDLAKEFLNVAFHDTTEVVFLRKYWFASYRGSDEKKRHYMKILLKHGFEPCLYSKIKGKNEKGVDIGLSKEMLVNAFNQNFDTGILIAGDQDYVDLVYETKRYGQVINGFFFESGLAERLKLSFDNFYSIDNIIEAHQKNGAPAIVKLIKTIKKRCGKLNSPKEKSNRSMKHHNPEIEKLLNKILNQSEIDKITKDEQRIISIFRSLSEKKQQQTFEDIIEKFLLQQML